jgi:ATP-dependent DNA ligase
VNTITRPHYGTIELAVALKWQHWPGWHLSEKADGICTRREFADCAVWGDAMRDGRLMVWDIDRAFGQDIRRLPWTERNSALNQLFGQLPPTLHWHRCPTGHGTEFIEAVLERNGEGVVVKPFNSGFGIGWHKVKRYETHDCVVVELHPVKRSVRLEQVIDGAIVHRGWCSIHNRPGLEVGTMVEVGCQSMHRSGKFREPRIVRLRGDKGIAKEGTI